MTKWQDRTRGGFEYHIFGRMTKPHATKYPIRGEVFSTNFEKWKVESWTDAGYAVSSKLLDSNDLIPIFRINTTGWYKTRDGRRVLIGWIDDREGIDYPCVGRICTEQTIKSWNCCGKYHYEGAPPSCTDIVAKSKWETE